MFALEKGEINKGKKTHDRQRKDRKGESRHALKMSFGDLFARRQEKQEKACSEKQDGTQRSFEITGSFAFHGRTSLKFQIQIFWCEQ